MKSIIIIDDDEALLRVMKRRFERTGHFNAQTFTSPCSALQSQARHTHAVLLDLMLENQTSLTAIETLKNHFTPLHLIIITGYASIATTVEAMKRGATDYIPKPVGFQELRIRLEGHFVKPELDEEPRPLTPAQVEWEHIQRTLSQYNHNISATAKALGMHRRSLQRKLQKYSSFRGTSLGTDG